MEGGGTILPSQGNKKSTSNIKFTALAKRGGDVVSSSILRGETWIKSR